MSIFATTRDLAITLTRHASVNGTAGEREFAGALEAVLLARPALVGAGLKVRRAGVAGDPARRENVFALLPGRGPRTVLLTGHYDTVGISDFGDLLGLAVQPVELAAAWLSQPLAEVEPWMADIRTGDFLPGRGLLDMKSGLAAAIAAMELLASAGALDGNLLFIATPDEEAGSAGMRAAAQTQIPAFLAEHGLDPVLAINLDALSAPGDGRSGQVVAFGTMGKLLLSAYCIGRETHACYPASGCNAAVMAAALALEIEGCTALTDPTVADAPPPVTLQLRDLKRGYDVTTPGHAWAYWNIIVYERTARDILAAAAGVARQALEAALPAASVRVLTYAELVAEAERRSGGPFRAKPSSLATPADGSEGAANLPEMSMRLTRRAWEASGLSGPAVILGFASTPYPPCRFTAADAALRNALEQAARRIAIRCEVSIGTSEYLAVISDMSFLGRVDAGDLRRVRENTPVWEGSIDWSVDGRATPEIPCINAGPWGRGYHNARERVHQPYAFEVLPQLVAELAKTALEAG